MTDKPTQPGLPLEEKPQVHSAADRDPKAGVLNALERWNQRMDESKSRRRRRGLRR